MKQKIHNGGCQICECLCVGGEVTGDTCFTLVLSGFHNESNVMGPYEATITPACFYKEMWFEGGHLFTLFGLLFQ